MIDRENKFIFIFQHKCAGSSIVNVIKKFTEFNHDLHLGTMSPQWDDVIGDYKDYFVFAVTRNPYDRAVSGWKHLQKDLKEHEPRGFKRGTSFKNALKNLPTREYLHDYVHITACQTESLLDKNGELVTDMLLRMENLQQDFDIACDIIGIERYKVPHINKTKHMHYTKYYDDESRAIVEEHFAKDFEYLDYEFEG